MTPKKVTMEERPSPRLFVEPGLLKEMIQMCVQEVLEEEVSRHLGAGPYERSTARQGRRNGSKPRTMKTAVGQLDLRLPQVREGGFRTQLFDRWQRSDKALVAAMQEMVVSGVSTRAVSQVLEEMGGFEVSAATVSRTMAELDEQIAAFFSRPLGAKDYLYLVVDARYEKVRRNGRVVSQAVLIAAGITREGRRELLSLTMGDSESFDTWSQVFSGLKSRGLKGVELVVSDAHKGIIAAMDKHLQGVAWQRCKVHLMRELRKKVSYRDEKELGADLRSIYASGERAQCLATAEQVSAKWEKKAPKMSQALREGVESTLTVLDLPPTLARRLNSTNMLERAMKEIKKRTRQVNSFPNEASCRRLIGAVLLEMQDRWDVETQRYIIPEPFPF